MKDNIVKGKSYAFALRVIKAYKYLNADFINKMNIALKEANETGYWLMLLRDSDYITAASFTSIHKDCEERIKMLASIVKTTKECNEKK